MKLDSMYEQARLARLASYKPWQPKKQRHLFLGAVVCVALCLLVGKALAQNKTFDMHVEMMEEFVGCLNKKDAVDIIEAIRKGERVYNLVVQDKMGNDVCRVLRWPITYRERVYNFVNTNGEHSSVYRGQVGGKDIFVPMVGFQHNSI